MNFLQAMTNEFDKTVTENGADAYKTTGSDLLNLFGIIGGLRGRVNDVENLFAKAYLEDKLLAMKLAFYTRNIRGGLGERDIFREIIKYLAKVDPKSLKPNLKYISEFGRWDDVLILLGTPLEDDVMEIIKEQLSKDWISDNVSLLAKWLPSVNASSKKTKKTAKYLIKKLETTEKDYRQVLSKLRAKIKIVETQMSQKKWNEINYPSVPSKAMILYRKSFSRNDLERFSDYIDKVSEGKEKINSSTLYPYDIILGMNIDTGSRNVSVRNYDKVLEEQWKALPNYVDSGDVLVMADTSGSMTCDGCKPIATSVGLAVYFAQRNKGRFHNTFMTFSDNPEFIQIKDGATLYDTINSIPSIVADTNIEKAFIKILGVAVANKLNSDELPKALVIISDMEFNRGVTVNSSKYGIDTNQYNSLFDKIKKEYEKYGYEVPNVVFWNVNSRNNHFQIKSDYKNVQLASGSSPSVFKSIINNIGMTPYEAMVNVLNDPMYNCIKV